MNRVIVQVVQSLAPGGIETMALELQRRAEPGDVVHIVSLEGEREERLRQWPLLAGRGDSLHFLGKPPGLSPRTLWRLYRLLRRLRPDLVHTHHIGPLIYGGLAARLARVTAVLHTEHDAWHLRAERRREVERLALSWVRPLLVADARLVAAALRISLPGSRPRVIHNGVDVERFTPGPQYAARAALGLPQWVPLLGCAARLEPVKGHTQLLDALFRLRPDVHLALAGDGPERERLRRQAEELGIAHRVHFLGRVDAMPTFYRAIDLFVLASLNEGLPLSPLEAQACGTPALLTNVGGCREALCPVTGLIVRGGDSRVLAAAIGRQLFRDHPVTPRLFVLRERALEGMVRAYNRLAFGDLPSS